MPDRLNQVTIRLQHGSVELPWGSRERLLDEINSLEGTEQVVSAFTAVGASAPVNLGRTEKVLLVEMIDRWAADIGTEQLPVGVWDLKCALVDDLAAEV